VAARAIADRFLDAGGAIDFDGWRRAVDATARRVGLLLSGDLDSAARLSAADADAIRDLLVHSVGEDHAVARHTLGVTVA
jgi:hypothetical protein